MFQAKPRHVRVSTEEFDRAPGVSLEAWGLLLWIGRFRAERWPSNVIRVADLGATGASIRRLRRLLMELWNAALISLVDDDAEAEALLMLDDEEAASKLAEAIDQRVFEPKIGKSWRIICEMLAEDGVNLSTVDRGRLLNRERQRRHRFRQKLKKQLWLGESFRMDDNGVTSRPSNHIQDPPYPRHLPAQIAAPPGARGSVVASGALGSTTPTVEQNRPEKSLGGGPSLYPPAATENAPLPAGSEASSLLDGATLALNAMLQN